MKQIKVGVIGLGYWGPNVIRNLHLIKEVAQIHGCDLLESNLNNIKHKYPTVKLSQNFEDILNDSTIDAVIVVTPINTHFNLAQKSLLANKHVLVEKPMTLYSKQSRELIDTAKKQSKILMVGHTFVYSEPVRKIKSLINSNQLGKIYYFDSIRINLGLIQKDSNVVWDLAPHDLSIISHLFKEKPILLQAFGSKHISNKIEIAHIFIKFENNISAHINVSWLSPLKIRQILIGGDKKMITWNDIEPSEKIKIFDKGIVPQKSKITPFSPAYRSGDVLIPKLEQNEALLTELSHFTDCIINNKEPLTPGEEGLKVVTLLEAIDKAMTTHKEISL